MVVSLTLPPDTPVGWVEDLADGLTAGIRELGAADCSVAGGDLGRGREISVTVAVLGTLDGGQPVLRSGARRRGTSWPWQEPWAGPLPGWPFWNRTPVDSLDPAAARPRWTSSAARCRPWPPARWPGQPAPPP